jgi:hypothetical protein
VLVEVFAAGGTQENRVVHIMHLQQATLVIQSHLFINVDIDIVDFLQCQQMTQF